MDDCDASWFGQTWKQFTYIFDVVEHYFPVRFCSLTCLLVHPVYGPSLKVS